MASDNEDDEEDEEEGWGNYDVNDSDGDDDVNEAPLSIEAQRRQQEERKTWAPRRPQSKPRNQRPLSFSERLKRDDEAKEKKKKAKSESPVLVDLSLDSSSSSSSDNDDDEDKVNEEEDNDDDDSIKSEEMGGDPLYLVYDDVSPKRLWRGKDSTNPYLRSVTAWVKFNDGHVIRAINSAQGARADSIVGVHRTLRCVPLSDVLEDRGRYPHLMVPLRTVFVTFAFYDSDAPANDAAIMHPATIREVQELPMTIVPNVAIARATRLFKTVFVTLIRGQGRFRMRDVFAQVAKWMPATKRSVTHRDVVLSVWNRAHTFFFAVDRPGLLGVNTRLQGFLETIYAGGLFDSQWLHAPALLQHMLQLGLMPEKRTKRRNDDDDDDEKVDATGGAWTDFLTKGLYDPRLFLFVGEFLSDRQETDATNAELHEMVRGEWVEEPFFDADRDRNADIFQEYWNVYYDRE